MNLQPYIPLTPGKPLTLHGKPSNAFPLTLYPNPQSSSLHPHLKPYILTLNLEPCILNLEPEPLTLYPRALEDRSDPDALSGRERECAAGAGGVLPLSQTLSLPLSNAHLSLFHTYFSPSLTHTHISPVSPSLSHTHTPSVTHTSLLLSHTLLSLSHTHMSLVGGGASGDAEILRELERAVADVHGSYTLHPHPATHTPHPTPYTLHPTTHTPHPTPYILHPTTHTPHPTPYTLHPTTYQLEQAVADVHGSAPAYP